jgi:hypothetical protein
MVMLGLVLTVWSLYRYWHVNRDIVQASFQPLDGAVYTLTVLLLLLGGMSAVWLLFA